MIRFALAFATALLAGTPALAQPSEAAQAYTEAAGFTEAVNAVVPSILAQEEAALREAMPMADEEAVTTYLRFFAEELEARLPGLGMRSAELGGTSKNCPDLGTGVS